MKLILENEYKALNIYRKAQDNYPKFNRNLPKYNNIDVYIDNKSKTCDLMIRLRLLYIRPYKHRFKRYIRKRK